MPRELYSDVVLIPNASTGVTVAADDIRVIVRQRGTITQAVVYTSETANTVQTNPFLTVDGRVEFWADPGEYDIYMEDALGGTPRIAPKTIAWDSVPSDVAPTVAQKDALAGVGSSAPSSTNPFLTRNAHIADTYANIPVASAALNGARFFATDKLMEWQCVAGAWVLVNAHPLVSATAPASPVNGQRWRYVANSADGVVWEFVWRDAATHATRKWECVGYSDWLRDEDDGTYAVNTGSYAVVGGANNPEVTTPFAGDYLVLVGGRTKYSLNTSGHTLFSYQVGVTAAQDVDAAVTHHVGVDVESSSSERTRRKSINAAVVVSMRVGVVAGNTDVTARHLSIRPARVGSS